jgi:hypothetical protein
MIELGGDWAGVGLGAESPDGITPGAFVIAEVADAMAPELRTHCRQQRRPSRGAGQLTARRGSPGHGRP